MKKVPNITPEEARAMMNKCLGGIKAEKPKEEVKTDE